MSFHHTKPWGFGEGGCAIVDVALADTVRALLNFGVGADPNLAAFASNGKMSDLAAALITQRLEQMPHWAQGYRRERRRISELALSEGLNVLVQPPENSVVPHVPVLAHAPVAFQQMPSARFAVAKYYQPLAHGCTVAADLYSRIVNVPCHPGMAMVDDEEIRQFFRALPTNRSGNS